MTVALVWEQDCVYASVQDHKMASYTTDSSRGSAVNGFIDQGKFEAMKTMSGRRAPRCGKHQFCAKITNTQPVLEPFQVVRNIYIMK